MKWNTGNSILGTTDAKREANTIFTATFIGLVAAMKLNRVDMEFNMDLGKSQQWRTDDDLNAMARLNNVCSKVNSLVRLATKNGSPGITWGLTPVFARGTMIAGGDQKWNGLYSKLDSKYLLSAWRYLVVGGYARGTSGPQDLYIGRGAYCGLVIDAGQGTGQGDALAAMPTIRTTLRENDPLTEAAGPRWSPPKDQADSPLQAKTQADPNYAWGMINSSRTQKDIEQQGMKFFGGDPTVGKDIVAYTHGMIRAIYEVDRIGGSKVALPYEMSIGGVTSKLASCMGCTFFMVANGYSPSSSHLGKGESWAPLYHQQDPREQVKVPKVDGRYQEGNLGASLKKCNDTWAAHVSAWMRIGTAYMMEHRDHVEVSHQATLQALHTRIGNLSDPTQDYVVANLLLDALTVHESDAVRLDATLTVPASRKSSFPVGTFKTDAAGAKKPDFSTFTYDWSNSQNSWQSWKNPFASDSEITALFAEPTAEEIKALFKK